MLNTKMSNTTCSRCAVSIPEGRHLIHILQCKDGEFGIDSNTEKKEDGVRENSDSTAVGSPNDLSHEEQVNQQASQKVEFFRPWEGSANGLEILFCPMCGQRLSSQQEFKLHCRLTHFSSASRDLSHEQTVVDNKVEERKTEAEAQNDTQEDKVAEILPVLRRLITSGRINKNEYVCKTCGMRFTNLGQLKRHYNREHIHQCLFCKRKFKNKVILHQHERWHYYINKMRCNQCLMLFETLEEFDEHMDSIIIHKRLPKEMDPSLWCVEQKQ